MEPDPELWREVDAVFSGVELTPEIPAVERAVFQVRLPTLYCSHADLTDPDALFAATGNGFTLEMSPERMAELRAEDTPIGAILAELMSRYGTALMRRLEMTLDEPTTVYLAPVDWVWGPRKQEDDASTEE